MPRQRRRRRRGTRRALAVAVVVVVIAVVAALGWVRLKRPLPIGATTLVMLSAANESGGAGFTWPSARESAVTVSGMSASWESPDQPVVPIASVTKIMTAYIVLRDHPLHSDADDGPTIPVTAADAAIYQSDVAHGDSTAAVAAGVPLTEREALEALMLPSADNIADLLAVWDAGSVGSFAAKMNAQARALGMTHTDYTDPSGLDPTTVSTAHDQLIIAGKAMAVPALAAIVALPSASIPVAGTIRNYNQKIGQNGIIGVKTGSDSAAQGCWAFAVRRVIAGTQSVVYGVVLGAPWSTAAPVTAAIAGGVKLANQAPKVIHAVTVLPAGTVVARITVPWSSTTVAVVTARPLTGLVGPGTSVSLHVSALAHGATFLAGQRVGSVSATGLSGTSSTTLVTAGASGKPSLTWRLFH